MKFTTLAGELKDAIAVAGKATAGTPSIVAYSGVRVLVTDEDVTVVGSDGETTISCTITTAGTDGAALLIPGPVLQLLSRIPAGTPVAVTKVANGDIQLHPEGMSPYRFRELVATFPASPPPTDGLTEVDTARLAEGVDSIRAAVGRDGVVHCAVEDTTLVVTATDSYRLHQVRLPGCAFLDAGASAVIPLAALDQVGRLGLDRVGLDPLGKHLRAAGPAARLQTRLADIRFPPVSGPVQAPCAQWVTVPAAETAAAVERLGAVDTGGHIQVEIDGSRLTLVVDNLEVGYGSETVQLKTPAVQTFSCLIGREFLLDALKAHRSATVEIGHSGSTDPVKVRSSATFECLALVMPVRRG